ncbi:MULTISPECIES: hypothetical protein [unclassified Streptomyces]
MVNQPVRVGPLIRRRVTRPGLTWRCEDLAGSQIGRGSPAVRA